MKQTVTKVKYDRMKNRIHIAYIIERKDGLDADEYSLRCNDRPKASFVKALDALAPHVLEACEISDYRWAVDLEVRGVSFTWTDEIMGAVITAMKTLSNAQGLLIINTPHKPESPYSTGDPDAERFCLTADCAAALEKVLKEANEYIKGRREQMPLPFDGKQPEAA